MTKSKNPFLRPAPYIIGLVAGFMLIAIFITMSISSQITQNIVGTVNIDEIVTNIENTCTDRCAVRDVPPGLPEPEFRESCNNACVQIAQEVEAIGEQEVENLDKNISAFWGLHRALLNNALSGVTVGFEKKLELVGVGFKVSIQGNKLILNVGFSHSVEVEIPDKLEVKIEKNIISISGIDKRLVGQTAADIRAVKPPEPYKGKGIKYIDEIIRRKAGKKAVASG